MVQSKGQLIIKSFIKQFDYGYILQESGSQF